MKNFILTLFNQHVWASLINFENNVPGGPGAMGWSEEAGFEPNEHKAFTDEMAAMNSFWR